MTPVRTAPVPAASRIPGETRVLVRTQVWVAVAVEDPALVQAPAPVLEPVPVRVPEPGVSWQVKTVFPGRAWGPGFRERPANHYRILPPYLV